MDFRAWTYGNVDHLRRRRLAMSLCIGSGIVAGAVVLLVKSSSGIAAQAQEEEAIAVELATEPEPEPEPEPPPPAETPKPVQRAPKLSTPTSISDEKLAETEVKKDLLEAEPEEKEAPPEEPVKPVVEAPKPPPPPPPPPKKPAGPIRITEEVTPPEPISQTKPEYPAALKAQGIEGVVMVRLVISETGTVTEAKVLKGPAEFHATCLNVVKTWRYRPAILDGKPVSVVKIVRIPFKLRT
jgi:protein TonB